MTAPTVSEPAMPKPPLKMKGNGSLAIDYSQAKKVFGSDDPAFIDGFIGQLANIGSQGREIDEKGLAFVSSIVKDIEPRDQLEAMLAAQMAAVHSASMTFARRLAHVDTVQQQDSAARAFVKLTRTFTAQMDALKRYRSGGEQKMVVKHVHVSDGGQAVIGQVGK